jgi:hypothetical protein
MKPKLKNFGPASYGAFNNRAGPPDGEVKAETLLGDCCSDPLVFAMRDRHHDFSIGLLTVLKCLKVAEQEGFVPPLPEDWWPSVKYAYGEHYRGRFVRNMLQAN